MASGAFALILLNVEDVSRGQTEGQVLETAKAISRSVDRELERGIGVVTALSASKAAKDRDWKALDQQARSTLVEDGAWILVQDRSGQQLVNTRLPPGTKLPRAPAPVDMWRELENGKPRVCNLAGGQVAPWIVCIDAPLGTTKPEFAVSMVFEPALFRSLVTRDRAQNGDIATLVDRTGTVIWRNRKPDEFIGQKATGSMLAAISSKTASGVKRTVSLENVRMLSAYDRSSLSGWSVIVGVPLDQVEAAARGALWRGSILALLVLVISGAVAVFLAGRLVRGVALMTKAMEAAGQGKTAELSGIRELDEATTAVEQATIARLKAEMRKQVLIGELNHRVKNTLAIVQSFAHQTFRNGSSPETALDKFEGRLGALAGAHEILTRERWVSASLKDVISTALKPFCSADRCQMDGPDVTLAPQTGVSLSLALHELATNAAKYGSLSTPTGLILVSWRVSSGGFELQWQEIGGPTVSPPNREGFGMRLIKRLLTSEFESVDVRFEDQGIVCIIKGAVPAPENLFKAYESDAAK
ncbi:sensor histidine kinase [Sphingomonas arenae]|uniref:sensor histidine kinase n=1 Tax=Sphingomonas arenae TaxID=2812555 RepID=UPI001967E6D5|nr:sensor histidine kinase [Sphingomonas arenae]